MSYLWDISLLTYVSVNEFSKLYVAHGEGWWFEIYFHDWLLMLAACRHYWAKIIMPDMRGHWCFVTSFMSKSWFKINQSLWIIDALHIISLNVGFKFSKDRLRLWNSTPCVDRYTWPLGCMDKLPWHDGTLFEPNLPLILNFRDSQDLARTNTDSMRGRFCIPRKPTGCQNTVNNFLDWILFF